MRRKERRRGEGKKQKGENKLRCRFAELPFFCFALLFFLFPFFIRLSFPSSRVFPLSLSVVSIQCAPWSGLSCEGRLSEGGGGKAGEISCAARRANALLGTSADNRLGTGTASSEAWLQVRAACLPELKKMRCTAERRKKKDTNTVELR